MIATIPGWSPELERSFKEVLFRFLEEVQSTKAALYLVAPDGSYLLATQYGFRGRDLLAKEHLSQDPIVKKIREVRHQPVHVNDPHEFPQIADYLEGAGTARILLVPLYGASRILGFVDVRDKGGKRPFEEEDLSAAKLIGEAILELVALAKMYEGLEAVKEEPANPRSNVLRIETGSTPLPGILDRRGLTRLYESALSLSSRQKVVAVALTVSHESSASTLLLAGEKSGEVDVDALQRHQSDALRQAGGKAPQMQLWKTDTRRVPGAGEGARSNLVATGILLSANGWSLVASVIAVLGSPVATEVLERLRRMADAVREASALRRTRRHLARRLLQPGETEYPELTAHSLAVSRLSWRMAQELGVDEEQSEEAALAGLLHDVGMRELDYDLIYRHRSPGRDEREQYKRHVTVGERIIQGAGMDNIVAAVRHHHERWDGKGYPDRLPGAAIPFLARLVHVAEVFDVLTAVHSYRQPVSVTRAVSIMKAAAGHQFDPEMVELLARVAG